MKAYGEEVGTDIPYGKEILSEDKFF